MCKNFQVIINSFEKSKFRSSFNLTKKDIVYINKLGLTKIASHAKDFIIKRIAPEQPKNDGK